MPVVISAKPFHILTVVYSVAQRSLLERLLPQLRVANEGLGMNFEDFGDAVHQGMSSGMMTWAALPLAPRITA
jgi:hypothetical protein